MALFLYLYFSLSISLYLYFSDPSDPSTPLGKAKKKRKPRTCFSVGQMLVLENTFQQTKYVSITDRGKLAGSLGLTDSQIKVRNSGKFPINCCRIIHKAVLYAPDLNHFML